MAISLEDLDYRTRAVLRQQAWRRAKGELESMLVTYYSTGPLNSESSKFDRFAAAMNHFIETVEGEELYGEE